jgi:hypothetical protein
LSRRLWLAAVAAGCLSIAAEADDTPPASPPVPTAANDVGRSIFVANDVDGQAGNEPAKHIAVNDDIVFAEDITTGADAKAVIEFRDGSTFEIGPEAVVRIDSFIFNPEESTSHKTLNVTRGVFRYVSAYVASDQDTNIKTPGGQMGIRGSVAEGVVDPAVPDFIYLGEGSATFTNAAGSSALQAGNSIAVPSAATPPMAPEAMPAPVAAQALQVIETRLPPRSALANRPAADDAWLKRAGAADLAPISEQQRVAAAATTNRPLPPATGSVRLAGELGLLTEANRLNLFAGRQAARTPEQTAFLARAARENPNAVATMRRFTAEAHVIHSAAVTAGTALVIRGVGHAAPSVEVMRRVTAASTRANPGAAALITHHATESYHGADRGELNHRPERGGLNRGPERGEPNRGPERGGLNRAPERGGFNRAPERGGELNRMGNPGNQRPAPQGPYVHPPNAYERQQPGARPPLAPQPRSVPKAPPKPPVKGPPPKKKGDEPR